MRRDSSIPRLADEERGRRADGYPDMTVKRLFVPLAALAIALGTGLGGDLIARVAEGGRSPALGIGLVDAAGLVACALALAAVRGVAEPKRTPSAES